MTIKKQYEMKDPAWIHLGNGKLTKGKVVDIFDLEHAGYDKNMEFYIIEIPTEIENLLEVRTWATMSQDAKGPIGAYGEIKEQQYATKKMLGKMGIELPIEVQTSQQEPLLEQPFDDSDPLDPTPEQVNAAIERAEQARRNMYQGTTATEKPKRFYSKKKTTSRSPKKLT